MKNYFKITLVLFLALSSSLFASNYPVEGSVGLAFEPQTTKDLEGDICLNAQAEYKTTHVRVSAIDCQGDFSTADLTLTGDVKFNDGSKFKTVWHGDLVEVTGVAIGVFGVKAVLVPDRTKTAYVTATVFEFELDITNIGVDVTLFESANASGMTAGVTKTNEDDAVVDGTFKVVAKPAVYSGKVDADIKASFELKSNNTNGGDVTLAMYTLESVEGAGISSSVSFGVGPAKVLMRQP